MTITEETYDPPAGWEPVFSPWRHGGWYVDNVYYVSGAIGCVSRNYPDKKWRIACDSRFDVIYPSRVAAARAEYVIAETEKVRVLANPRPGDEAVCSVCRIGIRYEKSRTWQHRFSPDHQHEPRVRT